MTEEKKLRIGIPKGSLQESTFAMFKKAGMELVVSGRSYYPRCADPDLEIVMVRAQEMARYVEDGVLDAGITGNDWVLENESDVIEVAELLYSKQSVNPVRWVVAVPEASAISSVKDLEGKIIATELVQVTKKFLKKNKVQAKVEFSWGATETKCPSLADAIVDLTETGNSLRANKLKIITDVLASTTRFIANKESWTVSWKKEKIQTINMLLQSVLLGNTKVMLEMNVDEANLKALVSVLPCMKSPTIAKLANNEGYAVKIAANKQEVSWIIPLAKKKGARDILEFELSKVVP
jgi:ATP phosphoribosyltransferase